MISLKFASSRWLFFKSFISHIVCVDSAICDTPFCFWSVITRFGIEIFRFTALTLALSSMTYFGKTFKSSSVSDMSLFSFFYSRLLTPSAFPCDTPGLYVMSMSYACSNAIHLAYFPTGSFMESSHFSAA